jgi:1,6-anhydro-N-acetylmuramate kinase
MVESLLLDRLRIVAQRKRWTIGLALSRRCRTLTAALVGSEGPGLTNRPVTFAHRQVVLAPAIGHLFDKLSRSAARTGADVALLAAQLAESQAALLDDFSAEIAPVCDRLLAVAVDDRGLWLDAGGLALWTGLCDSARLADLSGQNVIDAFAARDLAQDGRGRPLLPLPSWLLLRDPQKNRILVEVGRRWRLVYLPASRDASGGPRLACCVLPAPQNWPTDAPGAARSLALCMTATFPRLPPVEEVVLSGSQSCVDPLAKALSPLLPAMTVRKAIEWGLTPGALRAASVALLGMLHLDHAPANITALTGARTPRVLGRITPGSLPNWHRLLREMASARPSVISLRSAV